MSSHETPALVFGCVNGSTGFIMPRGWHNRTTKCVALDWTIPFYRSAVDFLKANRFPDDDHAGMIHAPVTTSYSMAGDVCLLPNSVAVGMSAENEELRLRHPLRSSRDHLATGLPAKTWKGEGVTSSSLVPSCLGPGRNMREHNHAGTVLRHGCELTLQVFGTFLSQFPLSSGCGS